MKILITLIAMVSATSFAFAQSQIDEIVNDWQRAKSYTQEYLEAMPSESFGIKPTQEIRSFAQQMLHLTDGNYGFASAATGIESPVRMGDSENTTDQSKENVVKLVLAGYDFVINCLKSMDESQLEDKIQLFGQFDMTKRKALEKCFEHQTHHRGQVTVYLRLAGVTPPQEKLF